MAIDWNELKNIKSTKNSEESVNEENVEKLEHQLDKKLKENETKARSWLTIGFIAGLFILIILAGVYVVYHNNNVLELAIRAKENNVNLSSDSFEFLSFESVYSLLFNSLGTSLGFIIGYYFKEKVSK